MSTHMIGFTGDFNNMNYFHISKTPLLCSDDELLSYLPNCQFHLIHCIKSILCSEEKGPVCFECDLP